MAAQEDHDCVGFGGYESQEENILCTTVIAFEDRISESRQWMELDFLMSCTDQVIDNMGRGSIAASAAKPLAAS